MVDIQPIMASHPEDDNGFSPPSKKGRKNISAYGLLLASIIHAVIKFIIYDC